MTNATSLIYKLFKQKDAMLFLAMSFVCGIYSSSTPDNITLAEVFIGSVFVYFVGIKGVFQFLSSLGPVLSKKYVNNIIIPKYVTISMIYLIFAPTIEGIIFNNNDIVDFIRDFIPLMYLFIPILLMHKFRSAPRKWLLILLLAICIIGIIYSIRHFTMGEGDINQIGKKFIWGGNLDNISQDPAVIYAMAFFPAIGLVELFCGRILFGGFALGLTILPWAANIASVTRASIGLSSLIILVVVLYLFIKNKMRNKFVFSSFAFLVPVVLTFWGESFYEFVENVVELLVNKNEAVGLSSRDIEALAVWNNVDSTSLLLFGTGWGGVFSNPINAGGLSRYTHNSAVYFFLKSGILGIICYSLYIFWFFRMFFMLLRNCGEPRKFTILISLIPPLFISLLLEPMYKSLSCGLILSIIPLIGLLQRVRYDH